MNSELNALTGFVNTESVNVNNLVDVCADGPIYTTICSGHINWCTLD